MKYYINREKNRLLKDENNTPYLKNLGYVEITKEEYQRKQEEFRILIKANMEKLKERLKKKQ